jgi:hypothetical protein
MERWKIFGGIFKQTKRFQIEQQQLPPTAVCSNCEACASLENPADFQKEFCTWSF